MNIEKGEYVRKSFIGIMILYTLLIAQTENWVYRYNGPGNYEDVANSIIYGADSNIYIAGASVGSGTSYDFVVISLLPDVGVEEKKNAGIRTIYGSTIFSGPLRLPEDNVHKNFDVNGRRIYSLNPAPGIYFVQANGKFIYKVVKIK